ncbi:Uu.00g105680.m01.CDS01 [Anthostomella pinea]|uniref:Uu.00g105680.m01.CDS01 n=1 Tax=Anthostomella pinea TaxID=933095 RepID=A0AAI8VEP3_9PEZI|nr:Uu.00g105680.m01.CDS01 [Anthostomella pinea]
MTRSSLAALAVVALAARVRAGRIPKPYFNWDETKHLIAFGDSYSFVQGTAGYPEYSFIGNYLPDDFSFTPETLLSNKIVQNFTGTAEGGPNWVEYLTGCGLEPGVTSPQDCEMQLWDFAFAGADVSEEFLALHHNFTTPLVNQTQQYLTWAEPVIGKKMDKSKALVAIWIGINDISDSAKFTNVTFAEFYDQLISTVFMQSVQPLHDAGYSSFLFVNLPPLDRTAANVVAEEPLPSKAMIGLWDDALVRHSRGFAAENPAAKTMVYDANTFLNGVLDEPQNYGITNTTAYCASYDDPEVQTNPAKFDCLPLDQYFWYNSGHMTSHTHKVMAPHMAKFLREQSTRQ